MMYLQNGELILRNFKREDIEHKVRWINDPENNTYLHYDIPLRVDLTLQWFLNKDNKKRCDCVIEYNGIPVGVIGLLGIDYLNSKAEYYITLGEKSFKRMGIATRATKMLIEYAFQTLKLHKLYLNVDEMNESACQLYEKVGFQCEGIFKDDLFHRGQFINRKRYAIINSER